MISLGGYGKLKMLQVDFKIEIHADSMKTVSVHARNCLLFESEVKLFESWCGEMLLCIPAYFALVFPGHVLWPQSNENLK